MKSYLLLLISTVLVNNFVLVKFLGLCPFMGVSKKFETAIGMGMATTFVLTLSAVFSHLIQHYILVPLHIEFLQTISFILVIAVVVQFTEMFVRKTSPLLYNVLGVALLSVQQKHTLLEATIYGFGASLGFSLAMILFASIRENIETADVPLIFRGPSISLLTAGLMSLAFMGFTGLA
jgi:electron transport complex protein RnfA